MSLRTVQRILAEDTLKPWRYRSWIHPRDPDFREKAQVILGLYEGAWEGRRLGLGDLVVCADEKPSIQARRRQVVAPMPGQPGLVESDYQRCGALQYLCAWDVQRGLPWGRCESKERDRGLRPPGRPGHGHGAVPLGPEGLLDRRQRLRSPRCQICRAPSSALPQPHPRAHARPRLVAQSAGNFLQHRAAQGADPRRRPRPSPTP